LADVVVVTERWLPLVENNLPIAEFVPSPGNSMVDTWWHLSSVIIKNAMNVFGFDVSEERRFNTKAWKLEQDDIKEDTCVLSEHYNIVFQRRQRV
jgi:hypothetical protein